MPLMPLLGRKERKGERGVISEEEEEEEAEFAPERERKELSVAFLAGRDSPAFAITVFPSYFSDKKHQIAFLYLANVI